MSAPTLRTERLVMRGWRPSDRAAFAAMNADPRVMEHFPGTMTRAESDGFADRIETHFAEHGFGLWAVEVPGVAEFIGFVGLAVPRFEAHFMPAVEVGWRLAAEWWGRGYATEAASACLAVAFGQLAFDEVIALVVPDNDRSLRVVAKLGMVQDGRRHAYGREHLVFRLKRPAQ